MSKIKVGVIGGGQLAWMMAKEAKILGIDLIVQTPKKDDPAVSLASDILIAKIDDVESTKKLAQLCDVVTFENEFVDLQGLQEFNLTNNGKFYPTLNSLMPLLDKYDQRSYLQKINLPIPQFISLDLILNNQSPYGFPVVLKAKRHGYDGQGTFILRNNEELEQVFQKYQPNSMMLEEFIPFEKELGIIAARNIKGEIRLYPVVETQQINQVCRRVIAPANIEQKITQKVNEIATQLLTNLQYVGVLGIELFLTPQGDILVNEIAPRTHNSGHYTLDGCETSQFKMQLQAVTDLPLGETNLKSKGALMINLLGYENSHGDYLHQRNQLTEIDQLFLHWYEKKESRIGRKLGHVTILLTDKTINNIAEIIERVENIWYKSSQI
jgi:5-(carboxyamino)imidazole ribonucleotide synthase